MKSIYLHLLIALFPLLTFAQDEVPFEYDKSKEDFYWSLIDKYLFDEYHEPAVRYKDTFNLKLKEHYCETDSIIIGEIFEEIKPLLTDLVLRFSDTDTGNFILRVYTEYDSIHRKVNIAIHNNYIQLRQNFHIRYDDVKKEYEKNKIRGLIVRGLITKRITDKQNFYIDNSIIAGTGSDYNKQLTEFDKFLLYKLYSPDFQDQYEAYLKQKDFKKYYAKVVKQENKQVLSLIATLILLSIMVFLFYRFVIIDCIKNKYLSFIISGTIVVQTILLIIIITKVFRDGLTIHYKQWSSLLFGEIIMLVYITIIYFIESTLLERINYNSRKILFKIGIIPLTIVPILFILGVWRKEYNDVLIVGSVLSILLGLLRGMVIYLKALNEARLKEKEHELTKLKALKTKAEMDSLHARINPHFLYNSLNSIAGLAHSDPDKTERMALSLSDLFRYTINKNGERMSTLEEEMKVVRTYLNIEQVRFGKRLQYQINCPAELLDTSIPKFILQPLVENAIKHGISNLEAEGVISIEIKEADSELSIKVFDNGPAFPEGLVSGYGLQSVHDLLNLGYGAKANLKWENQPDKYICVSLPKTI